MCVTYEILWKKWSGKSGFFLCFYPFDANHNFDVFSYVTCDIQFIHVVLNFIPRLSHLKWICTNAYYMRCVYNLNWSVGIHLFGDGCVSCDPKSGFWYESVTCKLYILFWDCPSLLKWIFVKCVLRWIYLMIWIGV